MSILRERADAMHVTLIRPPKITTDFAPHTQSGVPPVALACLAAVLEQAGHDTTVIDAYGESPNRAVDIPGTNLNTVGLTADEIAARVPGDTDVIGVTCMFSQDWLYAKRVIAAVHAAVPGATIIVGGEHVTADPEHALRSAPAVTACVLGEGEETLIELVDALIHGDGSAPRRPASRCAATTGRSLTAPRVRVRDVDDLPWPAWHLVPTLPMYLDNHFGFEEQNRRAMPMLATRGCPYRCTFCSSPLDVGDELVRARSARRHHRDQVLPRALPDRARRVLRPDRGRRSPLDPGVHRGCSPPSVCRSPGACRRGRAPKRSTRRCWPRWWRAAARRSSTRPRAARRRRWRASRSR